MTQEDVNVKTYVLPEETVPLLVQVMPSTSPLVAAWSVLENYEREGYLLEAVRRMEGLNYVGERAWYYQPLKFPRIARNHPVDFNYAPLEVKQAQVVWAVELMKEELFIKRRNNAACIALGIISAEQSTTEEVPKLVRSLLHRWLTSFRRV